MIMIRKFFINPDGAVIKVPSHHILSIMNSPEEFGLTTQNIHKCYEKHGEVLGSEKSYARIEIIEHLLRQGYIHVRYYIKNDAWKLWLYQYDTRARVTLRKAYNRFIEGIDGQEYYPFGTVLMLDLNGQIIDDCYFGDLNKD